MESVAVNVIGIHLAVGNEEMETVAILVGNLDSELFAGHILTRKVERANACCLVAYKFKILRHRRACGIAPEAIHDIFGLESGSHREFKVVISVERRHCDIECTCMGKGIIVAVAQSRVDSLTVVGNCQDTLGRANPVSTVNIAVEEVELLTGSSDICICVISTIVRRYAHSGGST